MSCYSLLNLSTPIKKNKINNNNGKINVGKIAMSWSSIAGVPSFGRNHFFADMFPVSLLDDLVDNLPIPPFRKLWKRAVLHVLPTSSSRHGFIFQWVHFGAFACPWSTLHFYFLSYCSVDLLEGCGSLSCFRVRYN